MNAYLRLFLSPRGAIGKRTYWHGIIVVTALNVALLITLLTISGSRAEWLHFPMAPILAPLLTFWFSVCVTTKRLRRLGVTPWRQAPARLFVTLGLVSFVVFTTYQVSLDQPPPALALVTAAALLCLIGALMDDLFLLARLGIFGREHEEDAVEVFA